MLLEELRLVKVKDALFPAKCGLATLISFALFGFVTAFPYILNEIVTISIALWPFVIVLAIIELLSLGLIKAKLLGLSRVKAAGEILLMGTVATIVGFGIGLLFPAD
jgi:VIT1/CCC1 family predicted Fe2+/Mn2+ transporter